MTTKYFIVCFFICIIEAYATPANTSDVLGSVKNELENIGNKISLGFKEVETGIIDGLRKVKHNIEQNPELFNAVKHDLKDVGEKISEGFKEAQNTVVDEYHKVEHAVEEKFKAAKTYILRACACTKYSCGCCAHLEEPEIDLNATICTNITYLVHDYGISFTVTVNKYALFNETVSVRNPPPVCLGLPYVKELADVCVRLYDIDATKSHLHACVMIEAKMKTVLIAKYNLGCFNIGPLGDFPAAVSTSMIPSESDIEKVFQKNSLTAQNTPNIDMMMIISFDEVPDSTTLDTTINDDELDFSQLKETASGNSTGLLLSVLAGLIGALLIGTLITILYFRIKKRRDERHLKLQFKKQYGSTTSLVPSMDPYC